MMLFLHLLFTLLLHVILVAGEDINTTGSLYHSSEELSIQRVRQEVQYMQRSLSLSREEEAACQRYANRSYVPKEEQRHPTLLWTFPGSGSGWVRLLIEHATGHYSGSVYGDESLLAEMPGEYECSRRVAIIKAHPTTHDYSDLQRGNRIPFNHRCKTIKHFDKAIMVIRNPYDAIWSDHNRKITRSHVGKIKKNNFDRKIWVKNAQRLAFKYSDMWSKSYDPFMKNRDSDQHLVVKFEDLINPDLQLDILGKMLKLLEYNYTPEKLKCAFYLANHPKVKRPIKTEDSVKKSEAYTKQQVCNLWSTLAGPAKRGQYTRYGAEEFSC